MSDEILQEAKKYVKDPDWIFDLYDFSAVWVSEKMAILAGYSINEFKTMNVYDLFPWDKKKTHKFLTSNMEAKGRVIATVKDKSGKILEATNEYYNISYNNGFYRIGKVIKIIEKSS